VQSFVELNDIELVTIAIASPTSGHQAYAEFGKGFEPWRLFCLCLRQARAKRLFEGDDFTMTDYYCSLTNLLGGANAWT
jgi:uncharacterized protein with PIN domain